MLDVSNAAGRIVDALYSTSLYHTLLLVLFTVISAAIISVSCVRISDSIDENTKAINKLTETLKTEQAYQYALEKVNNHALDKLAELIDGRNTSNDETK